MKDSTFDQLWKTLIFMYIPIHDSSNIAVNMMWNLVSIGGLYTVQSIGEGMEITNHILKDFKSKAHFPNLFWMLQNKSRYSSNGVW